MGQGLPKHGMRWLTATIFTITTTLPFGAFAKSTEGSINKEFAKELVTSAFEHPMTPERSLLVFATLGTSQESLRTIYTDMTTNAASTVTTVKDDKVYVNGKYSGLKISSYSPLNLSYKGKIWAFDKSKAIDVNYMALSKFLSAGQAKSASFMSFLLPTAEAEVTSEKGKKDVEDAGQRGLLIGGATTGSIAGAAALIGMCASTAGGGCGIAAVLAAGYFGLLGSGVGAAVGGVIGQHRATKAAEQKEKLAANELESILDAKNLYECNDDVVAIGGAGGALPHLIFHKKTNTITADLKDHKEASEYLSTDVNRRMMTIAQMLADSCKNPDDAARLNDSLHASARAALMATQTLAPAQSKPVPAPATVN